MKNDHGVSQGFGFCSFTKAESAMDAQEQLHQKHQIPTGEILYVQRAQTRREREGELKRKFEIVKQQKRQETKGVNLFVKNLEDEITDEMLRTNFTPYGVITSCKVMRDETNHSKGFGFVCFATPEEATKAVTELNGKIIITKPLYVAIAQRKEERRALLTQQFVNRQMTHTSRQNPQHLASGMMPAAATLMPYGPNFSANIPRAYNPALPPQQRKDMPTKPINITHLTSADPKQQNQILGETLFPIIHRKYPQLAGKITGMLLELEISELLFLLDSSEQLNAKMEEAYEVLQKDHVSVPDTGAYGQDLQQMSGARMREMRGTNFTPYDTNDTLRNNQGPVETRFATSNTSIRSSADVRAAGTPPTRNTVATIQHNVGTDTDTRIRKVPYNELLRQRSRMFSSSSRRLSDRVSSVKIRSVPSSPKRKFPQKFTLEQQTINLHPIISPNSSFQVPNEEVKSRNTFERKTQPIELVSPQKSECEDLISRSEAKSKDPICLTKFPSGGTFLRKPVPNLDDYGLRPITFEEVKHEMRRSVSQELPRNSRKNTRVPVYEKQIFNSKITIEELRSMNPFEQEDTLEAIIFPTIHRLYPDDSIQICEIMLQTFGVEEMIQIFQSKETLKSQIKIINESLRYPPSGSEYFDKDFLQEREKSLNRIKEINKHQTQFPPETVQIEYDVCTSRKSVEDKIYDTARREHPNEANLIVRLITEKRNKKQLQLIASSDVLMDHEIEKAHSKIRMLVSPMCQNYL